MQISISWACSEVTTKGVRVSTEADTLPVCSILELFNWVQFLRKKSEHVRGDAFWKFSGVL